MRGNRHGPRPGLGLRPGRDPLDETIVDSDRDGFSDGLEITSTPGTDPNDPTDNPNNVRDSDGDGCSDFDELNFPNFCDNDPNTSFCETTYYNADFLFGFDLPTNAVLTDSISDEGAIILGANWLFLFDARLLGVSVYVGEEPPQSLADFVTQTNQTAENLGLTIIVEVFPFALADGTAAYFTSLIVPTDVQIDTLGYRIDAFANGYVYTLYTGFPDSVPTEDEDAYMIAILDSLCVD